MIRSKKQYLILWQKRRFGSKIQVMTNALNGTTYLITFEIGTGGDRNQLIGIIHSYGTWAKITENSWAVVALGEKAIDIRRKLLPYIGSGGRLFVIKSGYESAWHNANASNDWLKKYLEN